MPNLDISKQAKKFLNGLDAKQFRQIVRKILSLMEDPYPNDSKNLKELPFRRTDIGEYRIAYRVEDNCLKIYVVAKRNDDEIYRKLKGLK